MVVMFTSFFMVTSVFFIMVTTVTVAMPTMMLIVVPVMTLIITVMSVMSVMAVVVVMKQRAQCNKSNRRANDTVIMMGLGRCAGQSKYQCATRCNHAQFVSCQVNHYYLPLYLVTPPI